MKVFKVGDRVRIRHSRYMADNLKAGSIHDVFSVDDDWVYIMADYGKIGLEKRGFFTNELDKVGEKYTTGQTYTDASGEKWTCIWVYPDGDATMDNGVRSARASEIEWETSVEWVECVGHYDTNYHEIFGCGARDSYEYGFALRFPLINGEPDFTQAAVTAA